jgi:hypothetical protein
MFRQMTLAGVLAVSALNCATPAAATTATSSDPLMGAASALASKIGVDPMYVSLAVTGAQALMGQGKDVPAAAKEGAAQAAAKATADGKPFTTDQSSGLLSGLTGMLGKAMP